MTSRTLLPVDTARARILKGAAPLAAETVPLHEAAGRVLARDLEAGRTQPPFDAAAMDGYAVRAGDTAPGAILNRIGMSRAGQRFQGRLGPHQTVRIFTGAPVPDGADAILIQEDADADGDRITARIAVTAGTFIRKAGLDFNRGDILLRAGRLLGPRALSLAAAMNHATLPVYRRPRVALLANGDELVAPGTDPGPDQIISSNNIGLSALVRECGGQPDDLGIAADSLDAIAERIGRAAGADILVTIGGASVGDHDLVGEALMRAGMALDFWKIAMRPGKPLMVGRLGETRVLGLPGNPVSALVTGLIFLRPLIRALTGRDPHTPLKTGRLAAPLPANDRRQDYLRARFVDAAASGNVDSGGPPWLEPASKQDSAMMATFASADALIVRKPHAAAAETGEQVEFLHLPAD